MVQKLAKDEKGKSVLLPFETLTAIKLIELYEIENPRECLEKCFLLHAKISEAFK